MDFNNGSDNTRQPAVNSLAHLVCASLSQQRAPLDVRSLAADTEIDWGAALGRFLPATTAWFTLTTCNRFELYIHDVQTNAETLRHLLHATLASVFAGAASDSAAPDSVVPDSELHRQSVSDYFDLKTGEAAAEHLCRVSAGMESKVFGESEILGQLTRAYTGHVQRHLLSPHLDAIVRAAIRIGKRVRHETQIGANAGSIGSLALQTVENKFRSCAGAVVAVIGAGEMGRLVARGAAARQASRVILVNRTQARAERVAQEINGEALPWSCLDEALQAAHIVFCATASPEPVITTQRLAQARAARVTASTPQEQAPDRQVLVDLAVPRDIEPRLADLPGIDVVDLDALQVDLDESLAQRHAALPQAVAIIRAEMVQLQLHLRELAYRPLIVDLRQKAENIRQQELARTLKHIENVDADTAGHIDHLTRALVNKLLHEPTAWIRAQAVDAPESLPAELVRDMFGLAAGVEPCTHDAPQAINGAAHTHIATCQGRAARERGKRMASVASAAHAPELEKQNGR